MMGCYQLIRLIRFNKPHVQSHYKLSQQTYCQRYTAVWNDALAWLLSVSALSRGASRMYRALVLVCSELAGVFYYLFAEYFTRFWFGILSEVYWRRLTQPRQPVVTAPPDVADDEVRIAYLNCRVLLSRLNSMRVILFVVFCNFRSGHRTAGVVQLSHEIEIADP